MIHKDMLSSKWPVQPLVDVVDFLDHLRKPITAKDRVKGPFPYYGANGQQDSVNEFIFDEPLILLAEDGGHFGDPEKTIAYRVDGKCWVNNHAHVLRPKEGFDINYLLRHLEKYNVMPYINGATRAKLTKGAASKILISAPPLEEQKRIAAILDKADAIRKKRKQSIELTEQFLRSAFLDMFGDPITNPKGWETPKLEDIGTLDRGKSKHRPRNDPKLLGGQYPLIQTGDVAASKGAITEYTSTYSEIGLRQSKLWPAGTLCITIAANIAKTGILTFDACFPDSVVGFTPNKRTTTEFIQFWLSFYQHILERTAPESAQKNINLKILRELKIPTPPIELQNEFTAIVEKTREVLGRFEIVEQTDNDLFNALTQRAFRGQL